MIFKISFKDTPERCSKAVVVSGRKISVLLQGSVKLPKFWKHAPDEIISWMESHPAGHISLKENVDTNTFDIAVFGHAKCHEEEKFDYVFGERLAEARAKYRIYKFFYALCNKLEEYYSNILYGPCGVADSGSGSCIARDMKKYEGLCIREAHHIGELLKSRENG